MQNQPKILVGMSGGVDSSVTVKLLQEQGYEVLGAYFVFHENAREGIQKAQTVAEKLGIKLIVKDCQEIFEREVVADFLAEYSSGRTPNPCIVCNPRVKFKLLADLADELGIEKIATGHYAQIRTGKLYRAQAHEKDQTYFLYRLPDAVLARLVLPLGDVKSKAWVQDFAKKIGIGEIFEEAGESQDFCFLGKLSLREMLAQNLPEKYFQEGEIVSVQDEVLGKHKGLVSYTLGQRKGIEIGGNGPWFVVGRDFTQNRLIVGREEDCLGQKFEVEGLIWHGEKPQPEEQIGVQVRFRAPEVLGTAEFLEDKIIFTLEETQKSITPGQSAVFYRGEECVGGGFIGNLLKSDHAK